MVQKIRKGPSLIRSATAPETMGLYSFNENTGYWVEEGTWTRHPSGEFYEAAVGHFSVWNGDFPFPGTVGETCVYVHLHDLDGNPIQNAYGIALGLSYAGYSEDISGFVAGDLIQLYYKGDGGSVYSYVQSFQVKSTETIYPAFSVDTD